MAATAAGMAEDSQVQGARAAMRGAKLASLLGFATLLAALALVIPAHGYLSDNEENYFGLALRFLRPQGWPALSAVFDVAPHRILGDGSLGLVVWALGYEGAQVALRLAAACCYALALLLLCHSLALRSTQAAIAVMGFTVLGQQLFGLEWLFWGYEAKVAAYVCVLLALRQVLVADRLRGAVLMLALATWFHFLVGGFWCVALLGLRLLDRWPDAAGWQRWRPVLLALAGYALLVAPLAGMMAWARLTDHAAAAATDLPPPDVIFSIIREPHHQSPFVSWPWFRDNWLRGYAKAAGMLLACLVLLRLAPTRRLRVLAGWLALLLAWMVVVLGIKWLDRDAGITGKFYLFRPTSLLLLLWILVMLAAADALLRRHARWLRLALLVLTAGAFLYVQGRALGRELSWREGLEQWKPGLYALLHQRIPGDAVVLIEPALELPLLDFERRSGRASWVNWKFTPTNDAEMIDWYRRMLAREAVFARGCGAAATPATFLLARPATAARLAGTCGEPVAQTSHWVLLAVPRS